MIQNFKSKETQKIFHRQYSKRLPADIQTRALRKLRMIDWAETLEDLKVPTSNRLEALKGDLKGFYSIRISGQWRIIFRFKSGNAFDVKIIDYH